MQPYKFLLVEDEAVISMYIEETLNSLGYNNIQKAYDATAALEYLSNEKFDMVLMDINLGGGQDGKDGIDVMNEIKKDIDIPFIYITGNSDHLTVHKAKFSQPDGFIVKPFNEVDLKITLELVLHKAETRLNKKDRANTNYEFSFEEDLKNLIIRLGPNGEIYHVNSHIKKLTDKPPVYYSNKKIENSGFDPFFASTLTNILNEVKNANRHLFYCNVKSNKHGERVMEVVVKPDNFANNEFESYLLHFNDVTDRIETKTNADTGGNNAPIKQRSATPRKRANSALVKSITSREKEVLACVKDGLSNKMIGTILEISPKTVSIHRNHLMRKMKVKNAAEMIMVAIQNNLISSKSTGKTAESENEKDHQAKDTTKRLKGKDKSSPKQKSPKKKSKTS